MRGTDTRMDAIERARALFRELEENNPKAAAEIARRAFQIQERLK